AGSVVGEGGAAGRLGAPVRGHGTGRDRRPAARSPARTGPVRGGGRRLPVDPPVAEGPSGRLPARAADTGGGGDGARLRATAGRAAGAGPIWGAAGRLGAPVRGHGTGRDRRPAARSPARTGPVRGGGRRLPVDPPVAEGPSGRLPARAADTGGGGDGARLRATAGRAAGAG